MMRQNHSSAGIQNDARSSSSGFPTTKNGDTGTQLYYDTNTQMDQDTNTQMYEDTNTQMYRVSDTQIYGDNTQYANLWCTQFYAEREAQIKGTALNKFIPGYTCMTLNFCSGPILLKYFVI